MTQFSFEWILSLNWLCQKWGQVQPAIVGCRVGRKTGSDALNRRDPHGRAEHRISIDIEDPAGDGSRP
jgi:hypothetical protein